MKACEAVIWVRDESGTLKPITCKDHPNYRAKREPKSCYTCWCIYGLVAGLRKAK